MTAIRYRRDEDGMRHRVVMRNGKEGYIARWTTECSGCFEAGEYNGNAHNYPYDHKAQCHIGAGCDECGYTGKSRMEWWMPFDWWIL